MSRNKSLHDFEEIIRECVKCGVCQAHCPAYIATKKEGAVARGKITLAAALLDGETGLEERLQQDMSMCLMCGSCVSKCPNKVPTHEIVGAVRREFADKQGLSWIGKGVSTVIGSKALMKTLSKGGAMFSPLILKKLPETSGLRLRLFQAPGMKGRTVPPIAFKNLFNRIPEFVEGEPDKPIIGFFAGCAITYMYPEIGEKMVQILNRMGFSVYTPKGQQCCGIPALSSGNGDLVEELSDTNMTAFKEREVSHIVTACASCNGGIGEYYHTMKGDHDDFTNKVVDFSVFLKEQGLFETLTAMEKKEQRTRVTYHDPCHLKVQGITREPRELLRSLPNVDFVEMEYSSACCGLGGTFSVYHYDTSKEIGARKMPGLKESGAEQIVTGCPGCIMQLQDSINHAGLPVKAVHLLDLVAEALR
ncbi:(Fe-S)-binding protein [Desulfopila sp. IMCC35008]|uniref:(Fe-S)-binding protein n=1 Tax=Desulfopila sp. IMCC35008 TaxID=2653858 RepID=UPI0013D1F87C|nr:(Fe-S)-binding protein [Desulfopila sp. IMCC35008]